MARAKKKTVRLADIAKAANVSISTVSLALADYPRIGEKTKQRLRQLSRELGYRRPGETDRRTAVRPAKRNRRLRRFGCMLISRTFRDESNIDLIEGLTSGAANINARMELASVDASLPAQQIFEQSMSFANRLDGIIVSGVVSRKLLAALEEIHLPYLVIGRTTLDPAQPLPGRTQIVSHDEIAMGRLAAKQLFHAGHSRVAFICEIAPPNLWNARWLTGYKLAHLDLDIPIDKQLIATDMPVFAGAKQAIHRMLQLQSPPTAVVCPDARVGKSALDALKDAGVQPRERSVILACPTGLAQRHGVTEFGIIHTDSPAMTRAALDHLARLCLNPPTMSMEIIIPFTTFNLPEPIAPQVPQGAAATDDPDVE